MGRVNTKVPRSARRRLHEGPLPACWLPFLACGSLPAVRPRDSSCPRGKSCTGPARCPPPWPSRRRPTPGAKHHIRARRQLEAFAPPFFQPRPSRTSVMWSACHTRPARDASPPGAAPSDSLPPSDAPPLPPPPPRRRDATMRSRMARCLADSTGRRTASRADSTNSRPSLGEMKFRRQLALWKKKM